MKIKNKNLLIKLNKKISKLNLSFVFYFTLMKMSFFDNCFDEHSFFDEFMSFYSKIYSFKNNLMKRFKRRKRFKKNFVKNSIGKKFAFYKIFNSIEEKKKKKKIMLSNLKYKNYMLLHINNFKKTLLSNYKSSLLFKFENIDFITINKNVYLILYFNYYFEDIKEDIFDFLIEEQMYFNVICIKYKRNFFSLDHFKILCDEFFDLNVYEDILIFSHFLILKKICNLSLFLFFLLSINLSFSNKLRCLLFINQLQN